MPELPDLEVYVDALNRRVKGRTLETVKLNTPSYIALSRLLKNNRPKTVE